MQIIELYINDTKVDLFEDESVSITDSIQNVRDISKIFTAFSQQFNLPASKTNNKLFKHYYNYDIDNGFDARYKADAVIKLNGVDYKKGKIRLNTVDLKDNAPYSYKVVFFGDTIELKELLAELKLKDLSFDESMNFIYNSANVKSRFTSTTADDIVVPLITHSKRFEIANDSLLKSINDGNTLLDYLDLKPAIKVKKIIDAIEADSTIGITFSGDFFNSEEFNNLYLWLHRNEGYISNADEGGGIKTVINRIHLVDSENSWVYNATGSDQDLRPLDFAYLQNTGFFRARYEFTWDIQTASTDPYTIIVSDPNGTVLEQEFSNGSDQTITWESPIVEQNDLSSQLPNPLNYLCKVQSTNTFTMTQTLTARLQTRTTFNPSYTTEQTANYDASTDDIENKFYVADNMPDMKVFDFLINLFKMFNLTVYKEDGVLVVEPLNDFYNSGKRYDITEYVDMSQSSVSKLLQFKNIIFNFKSKVSQLVQFSDELQGIPFSEESYGNDQWDGGDYKVELDFEKMMYERLTDTHQNPQVLTPITQGTMLDKKLEPTIGKPLLLYCVNTDPDDYIKWKTDNSIPTNYKRPSQIFENASNRTSLNFGLENDEFFLQPVGTNLFENYYQDYVVGLFSPKGRKLNISAYLPLQIILRYKLNDRFIINGRAYKINTIKTNLLTNKSDLELITDLISVSDLENGINPNAPRVAQPTVTTKDTSSVTLSWDAVSGVTGYKLYIDDLYDQTVLGTAHKFSPLESGITYKLGVQASYTNFDAPITNTIETTD
jgi:hypothetical protein